MESWCGTQTFSGWFFPAFCTPHWQKQKNNKQNCTQLTEAEMARKPDTYSYRNAVCWCKICIYIYIYSSLHMLLQLKRLQSLLTQRKMLIVGSWELASWRSGKMRDAKYNLPLIKIEVIDGQIYFSVKLHLCVTGKPEW